jgi:hypothetical protein
MADASRRFPAPRRAKKIPDGYVVRDANGQALAYLCCRDNEVEARRAKVLTSDEARRIATNLARLPELLRCSGRLGATNNRARQRAAASRHNATPGNSLTESAGFEQRKAGWAPARLRI